MVQVVRTERTNLCTNPSFETNTTGWTGFDCTVTQTSAEAYTGSTYSAAVAVSVANGVAIYAVTGATVGLPYIAKVRVKGTAGDTVFIQMPTLTSGSYAQITLTGGWDDLTTVAVNAIATAGNLEIGKTTTGTFYLDAVQLEQSTIAQDYFDGDNGINYFWSGTRHASTSYQSNFMGEEIDTYRNIAHDVKVSWKKAYLPTYRPFTIGISLIGGNDGIASEGALVSDWNAYQYSDESDYVERISVERELSQPIGGMSKALADVRLINTDGRFLPDYMGGHSELYTALVPRRPMIINTGFDFNGVYDTVPQFVGITTKSPIVNVKDRTVDLTGADFIDFLQKADVADASMYTSQRSDQVIEAVLNDLGFATAQYDLDYGINTIRFGEFQPGQKFGDIIHKIVQAENGHFYQQEDGKLRFDNRQKWTQAPYTSPVRVLGTSQVLEVNQEGEDQIINVVEVKSKPRSKSTGELVWKLGQTIALNASGNTEILVSFADPVIELYPPSIYKVYAASDGTGTDYTTSVTVKRVDAFARAAKITFTSSATVPTYITQMELYGRPAKQSEEIYYREQDDSSVTAYEERVFSIDNEYIQDKSWAQSYAGMILRDYAEPGGIQTLVIRAIPELQLGDMVSWQGRYWRIYGIKSKLSAQTGHIQELKLLQRTPATYFRIGISTIGGTDSISP